MLFLGWVLACNIAAHTCDFVPANKHPVSMQACHSAATTLQKAIEDDKADPRSAIAAWCEQSKDEQS